jgi:hypothetical protein
MDSIAVSYFIDRSSSSFSFIFHVFPSEKGSNLPLVYCYVTNQTVSPIILEFGAFVLHCLKTIDRYVIISLVVCNKLITVFRAHTYLLFVDAW